MPPENRPTNEWQTRRHLIDPKLIAAGWQIIPFEAGQPISNFDGCAITEYPTNNGPSDYALVAEGKVLGIIEAKKLSLGPQNVLTQAERYSKGMSANPLDYHGYHVPFLYSTNGQVIWHHDIRHPLSRSRQISGFHTPSALKEMLDRDFVSECQKVAGIPNDHPRLRPYQKEANAAVEQAIADHKHKMLLAMCTGSGKTFVTVNQIYRLMKSGIAKRVLFLVDRRALAAQAVRAFSSFEAEKGLKFNQVYEVYSQRFHREDLDDNEQFDPKVLPTSYLLNPHSGLAFVYVCTIQRMTINLFGRGSMLSNNDDEQDDDADILDIPINAFDLIIADECHRGYTSSELAIWRNTLDHFDAIKIGLTATPAAHTLAYFDEIVYRYEYSRAVREGYLVDYDPIAVHSDVRLQGITIGEGQQVGSVDPENGLVQLDFLEDEIAIGSTEIERLATSPDSNKKILEEIKKYALEHEQRYGRFPKTLIFAVNDIPHTSHADALIDIARDVFGRGDSFVQKITGHADRPLQAIREFRNRQVTGVVVTVDMLSTGVDIPDLEFIVFLRPVKSRILFEQMMGRGTRKGENYPDKSHFTVFDCFGGTLLQQFSGKTGITAEAPSAPSRTVSEIIEDIWQNRQRDYNVRCLVKRLRRVEKEMSGEAREMFAAFVPDGDLGRFAQDLSKQLKENFTETLKILRDNRFQDLMVNYPRPKRPFLIAYETKDQVSSTRLIRDASGKPYDADDYLLAFSRMVRENPEHIQAISILLNRPREWNPQALSELRERLKTAPEQFTMQNLQQAHQVRYKKALIDIISMVKHAATDQEPLLTAAERIERAFQIVSAGKMFSDEQQQWLDRIRQHLVENLSIGQGDFELVPVLSNPGGWRRANKVFEGKLAELIQQINEAVAA